MPHRTALGAEAAQTVQVLMDARAQVWRFECSALLLGCRFVDTCRRLGLDAHRLPAERRRAIDDAMAALPTPGAVDELLDELRRRLQQPLN
jgi:hypothetical protein